MIISATFIISTLNLSPVHSEKVILDDNNYQEYRGRVGRWVNISGKKSLTEYIRLFDSTEEDTEEVNSGLSPEAGFVFIPFGKLYVNSLEASGITRSAVVSAGDQFIWPVSGRITVSSVLGLRGGNYHTGIDIPAARGSVVRAAMEGQVIYNGFQSGYGYVIDIRHRNLLLTRYAHNTVNLVKTGDSISKGQVIALAGSTGLSTGSHLHFEVRCNGVPLDPMDFLPDDFNKSVLTNNVVR